MSMNRVNCTGCCDFCCGSGGGCTGGSCPETYTCNVAWGAFYLASSCDAGCYFQVPATSTTFTIQAGVGFGRECDCGYCNKYCWDRATTTCTGTNADPCLPCPGCWEDSFDLGGDCYGCSSCASQCQLAKIDVGLSYESIASASDEYNYEVTAWLAYYGYYTTGSGIIQGVTYSVENDSPACPGAVTSIDPRVTRTSDAFDVRTGWCLGGAGGSCYFEGIVPYPTWSIL